MQNTWQRDVAIAKLDEAKNLVFGWLSKIVDENGTPVVDRQGDVIPADELEKAAYAHVVEFRKSDVMHNQRADGVLVESFFSTPEKRAAMGWDSDDQSVGWWVGYRVTPETFAKVRDGQYRAFSIGGRARRGEA